MMRKWKREGREIWVEWDGGGVVGQGGGDGGLGFGIHLIFLIFYMLVGVITC